ncbi:Ribosome production factor 2 like protein [Cucumispora dikerogammari]|nr:Ribosome production factor 2 like protein [Cucumispora dikerogammari]
MPAKRTLILHENDYTIKDLSFLLSRTVIRTAKFDSFNETDKTLSLMKKIDVSILVSSFRGFLTVGRTYAHEFIDLYKYEIIDKRGFKDFKAYIEVGFKYFLVFQGLKEHELCFWTDLFQNTHSSIDIEAVNYVVVIKKVLDVVQVGLFNLNLVEVGPKFSLKCIEKHINEDVYLKALEVTKTKTIKNITKTDIRTTGRIHVPKQDFSALKLRKRK